MKKLNKEQTSIVIAGGGFGGMHVYRHLKRLLKKKKTTRITIVDRNNYFLFTPMLHEAATGSVDMLHVTQPIRECLRTTDSFVQGEITKIDIKERAVILGDGTRINADQMIVALGSETSFFGVPGVAEHALLLKNLSDAIRLRNHLIHAAQQATQSSKKERERLLRVVIVGGGWTGVEAAGQIADLFRKAFPHVFHTLTPDDFSVTVIHAGDRLIHHMHPASSDRAKKRLEQLGVRVLVKEKVTRVTDKSVVCESAEVPAGLVLWTAGVRSIAPRFFEKELLNERDRLVIEPTFQVKGYSDVYAIGDCADVEGHGHVPSIPQTAQAVAAGAPALARNVLFDRLGGRSEHFIFRHKGELVPIGDWYAIAEIGKIRFAGKFAWWLRRTVFLFSIFSWLDRIKVVVDWTLNIFLTRDTSEIRLDK